MPNPDGTHHNPGDNLRSRSDGLFQRNPASAERDAKAARLRSAGHTFQEIADQLGFGDKSTARQSVYRAIADVIKEPAEEVLKVELDRLDQQLTRLNDLETAARQVLEARHITVNNGRVILHPDTGDPMEDDAPVLAAIDRLVKIETARNQNAERRAKLTGLDAAIKIDSTVHEVTPQDVELQQMLSEAKAKMRAEEQQILDSGENGAG